MLPISEISEIWDALRDEQSGRSFEALRLDAIVIWVEVHHPNKLEAIRIKFNSENLQSITIPRAKGFEVLIEKDDSLILRRLPEGDRSVFARLVDDVLTYTDQWMNRGVPPAMLLNKFIGRVRLWQKFMSKDRNGLSKEQEVGLLGELYLVRHYLSLGIDPADLFKSWVGPDGASKDFLFNSIAVEVKTTTSKGPVEVKIQSLEQLDSVSTESLWLVAICFDPGGVGESLSEVIASLINILSTDFIAIFRSKLFSVGYLDIDDRSYDQRYALDAVLVYAVDDYFPRIVRSRVDAAISSVKYDLCLDGLAVSGEGLESVPNVFRG